MGDGEGYCIAFGLFVSIGEGCVGKSVAEGEKYGDVVLIGVLIADFVAFL